MVLFLHEIIYQTHIYNIESQNFMNMANDEVCRARFAELEERLKKSEEEKQNLLI
jgi:hypothetical protein